MNKLLTLAVIPYRRWPHLIKYWCFGFVTAGIDFAIFTSLVEFAGVYFIIANCISVFCGICVSFFLNSYYNFKVTDNWFRRFIIFLIVGLCGIAISNVILYGVVDCIGLYYITGKVIALVSVSLCKFTFNKFVTFKKQ